MINLWIENHVSQSKEDAGLKTPGPCYDLRALILLIAEVQAPLLTILIIIFPRHRYMYLDFGKIDKHSTPKNQGSERPREFKACFWPQSFVKINK